MPKPEARKKEPRDGTFLHTFRGKPAILLSDIEWEHVLQRGSKVLVTIVRYATVPPLTDVWVRYRPHFDNVIGKDLDTARWQCEARVIDTVRVGISDYGHFYVRRITLSFWGGVEETLKD